MLHTMVQNCNIGADVHIPEVHWPASLIELRSYRVNERHCPKNEVENLCGRHSSLDLCLLPVYSSPAHSRTQTYTYTHKCKCTIHTRKNMVLKTVTEVNVNYHEQKEKQNFVE